MKPRIIILEDDENARTAISILLQRKGYEVITAPDPSLCPVYSNPESCCPHDQACGDFLLTDNRMPQMTGLEFIEFQTRKGCKGIIVNKAVMSGSWTEEELEKAEQLGCKTFTKPLNFEELDSWLAQQRDQIPADRKLVSF